MGLTLNTAKCELIAHQDFVVQDRVLQALMRVDIGDTMLLGAPLSGAGLDKAWSAQCDDLATSVNRLHLIGAQDALILLRSPSAHPKSFICFDAHRLFHIRYSRLI